MVSLSVKILHMFCQESDEIPPNRGTPKQTHLTGLDKIMVEKSAAACSMVCFLWKESSPELRGPEYYSSIVL